MQVLLLTQEGCNPCRRVKRILGEIAREVPDLTLTEASFDSERGMELAAQHQILYPPAVLLDGRLVGKGKIREEELRRAVGAPLPRVP
jgi:glutaredoxin